jgi:Zn-dependent protease
MRGGFRTTAVAATKEYPLLLGGILPVSEMIAIALVALVAMTIHEFAHCIVADWMGDTTARSMGKLTLNPFVHIYWPGWIMFVLFGFGILGAAPVDSRRMRDQRWGYVAAVAAGPISNLLLAGLFAIPFKVNLLQPDFFFTNRDFLPTGAQVVTMMVILNITLFLLNLIPIPGFDGWKIMLELVPRDLKWRLMPYEQYALPIFLVIIAAGVLFNFSIIGVIINEPLGWLARLMLFP